MTEFEADYQKLYDELSKYNVGCIELVPNRNDFDCLKKFARFFNDKGFVVLFGTEHNTPGLYPLTVVTRGEKTFDDELEILSYENACLIAAHQYLVARGDEGYIDDSGKIKASEKQELIELGKAVVEWFVK
jgi:hypothetical protein